MRSQDYFTVLEYISANPVGLPIVWDFVRLEKSFLIFIVVFYNLLKLTQENVFLRNEWQYLVDRFTTNNRYLGRMVGTVTAKFTTQIRLDEVSTFK